MSHLVFVPEPEPRMFLSGGAAQCGAAQGAKDPPDPSSLVETLRSMGEQETVPVAGADAQVVESDGTAIPLLDALIALTGANDADLAGSPASIVVWALAAKLALELVARERIVPIVCTGTDGAVTARWAAALSFHDDAARVTALAAAMPPAAHALAVGAQDADAPDAPAAAKRKRVARDAKGARRRTARSNASAVWAPEPLLRAFLDAAADVLVRTAVAPASAEAPRRTARARGAAAQAPWERRLVVALTTWDASFPTDDFRARGLADDIAAWAAPALGASSGAPRVGVRLDLPPDELEDDEPAAERRNAGITGPRRGDAFRLAYFLQAARDPSLVLPAADVWSRGAEAATVSGTGAMTAFRDADAHLLRGLAVAARMCAPVDRSLRDSRPVGVALGADEAWAFLTDAAPALTEAGLAVVLPAELTRSGRRRLRLRMRVGAPGVGTAGVVQNVASFGLDEICGFRWEAAVGDTALTAAELDALARLKAPLVRLRGQWVAVDRSELADVRRLVEEGGGHLSRAQAIAAALAGAASVAAAPGPVEVVAEGALADAIARLRTGAGSDLPETIPGFHGELRPYQRRGVAWLASLARLGFGACLADDMGLGKTIQVLAHLLLRRHDAPDATPGASCGALPGARPGEQSGGGSPTLLVCPTSVVGNWEHEIARFAPSLPVVRHHGGGRARSAADLAAAPPGAVVLTTYGLLRRDASLLREVAWDTVVLDEAQNVKNAVSHTARAARTLRASCRIALTGTPVENRLAELWSILEFGNPGLLGPLETFRRETATPIERWRDEAASDRLCRVVGPFVLRRVKSDPSVIADLPPKNEMKVFCSLTTEQATLYRAAVDDAMERIEGADGIARRGRVLALLTALKQICNHPAQYLGESGPLAGRSGKLARVTEMLEECLATGDRALVFTQYREMGDRLVAHLGRTLGVECPFLHGGVGRAARDEMVSRFQDDAGARVFVLSLKAGGTGLNLTRATRVFHFDRWWNPAVEDQATDRAYRIGQTRSVQVHKLVTAGTVEEKVDRMLEDKRDLAARVVATGERWITELDDASLREVFALSAGAVVADASDRDADEAVR